MGKLVTLKLNLDKINKDKIFKGEKGKYYTITVSLNDQVDNYGNNVSCWEEQTKEERQAKADRNFLGNGRVVWSSDNAPQQDNRNTQFDKMPPQQPQFTDQSGLPIEDELPF